MRHAKLKATLVSLSFMGMSNLSHSATIELTGTVRDFCAPDIPGSCTRIPDFEGVIATEKGIVEQTIGADRKPVYNSSAKGADGGSSATTSGTENFDRWYNSSPGYNVSQPLSITLDNSITSDPNVFTFESSAFFPIDNQLFGNQGRSHNYHFTYELHALFTYNGGEEFRFFGDDDVFLFLNDQLAVDLGGVHGSQQAIVNLDDQADALGITPGNEYTFDLFFAERHTVASVFRIDTSIELRPIPVPAALPLLGSALLGLAGLSFVRRKKA